VHFPEAAMSGCSKAQIKNWDHVDWDSLGDELRAMANLARELGLWVVVGCAHRLTQPNRPHNSLYVISNRGEIATRYDKRFCSHTEITGWHTPGRRPCVFEVEGWRFGCILCIEIQFPELFHEYANLDADCILFSAYADDPMFGIQAQGYAASHNYWVSLSVPTQMSRGLSSRLIAPNGEIQRWPHRRSPGWPSDCSIWTARDGKSLYTVPSHGGPRRVMDRSIETDMSTTHEAKRRQNSEGRRGCKSRTSEEEVFVVRDWEERL